MIDILFPKLHKEGYRFLALGSVLTFVLLLISNFLGILSFILTVWIYYFFRDPERFPINDENYLVSPADGLVLQVQDSDGPKELNMEGKKFTKVSIFMNVFDCHVNRTPCSGKLTEMIYKPGMFLNASLDKASEDNERKYYKIKNSAGEDVIVVQIAGLIARRIVSEVSENSELKQGEKIGMIRFGSRADIYFNNYTPLVKVNQRTIAGETLIAKK